MNQSEILERLTKVIIQVLGDDQIVLTTGTSAEDVTGWDSFNHINIIVGAELEFGVKFNASELEDLKNVGDFVALIEKRLAKKN
ncbi:MAG TPA: acyl carrier protein [bacterium]|nr:acyl carrier protein [bacterium]